ncbi:hypothetical protein [Nitrosomonas halophila]|uniref:DUF2147 domain-containing protein n=1 Tax=Nitrosomonas halophila TaxID=44576 RepID=A0A1H3FHS4_9PROT|nr:hypothetical protein [Nitrosomonas halophila]SDX89669.1 hypothetical protein SAMN05421881_101178 [Nitrosomonas halophila]
MYKYFIKSVLLALLVLPLTALAEEERDLSFIDGIWQSYGPPPGLIEDGVIEPENKFYSLHYDQNSKTLVLIDLPTIDEKDIPVLMASFIGKEETEPVSGTKYFALDMVGYDENIGVSKEYRLHRLHVIFHTETEAEVMRWSPLIMLADWNWMMRKVFRHKP